MTELNESLDKVLAESIFIHRGTIVEKLIGGYRCLSKTVTSMDEVDRVIDEAGKNISDSIKKEQP